MDFVQALGAAIVLGSTLGATVAGFFAYRQKSLVSLLRESNQDYKDRNEQLEKERDELKKTVEQLQADVKQLKAEKMMPLESLTKLIIKQHAQNQKNIIALTKAIKQNTEKK